MGEIGDCLAFCMQMTWFCVVSWGRTSGWFGEVCRRRGQKVNAGKSKVIVLNGKGGLGKEGRECRLPDLLYADDLVLYGE